VISSAKAQAPTLIGCFFYLLKSFTASFPCRLSSEEVRIIVTKILLSTLISTSYSQPAKPEKLDRLADHFAKGINLSLRFIPAAAKRRAL
jgi:hypothetical protein